MTRSLRSSSRSSPATFPRTSTSSSWVREAAANPAALNDLIRYKYKPVGPREFVEFPVYMNKPGVLWPKVMDALCEMNDGTRTEAVLTGGIGVGEDHACTLQPGVPALPLSCMRNPHEEFDLDPVVRNRDYIPVA